MNLMLSTALTSGTGYRARPKYRPAAGKTGTSQNFRDGWFIGYTADLTAGVWVGNDNNTPMRNVTGGQTPARIWRQFIEKASAKLPARALTESSRIMRNDSRSRANEPGNRKSTGYVIKESEEAVEANKRPLRLISNHAPQIHNQPKPAPRQRRQSGYR